MDSFDNINSAAQPILFYLENIPDYPFDIEVDKDFVNELLDDFPSVDILDQIKAFRWHHNGRPAKHCKSLRPSIRRWLSFAKRFEHNPPF